MTNTVFLESRLVVLTLFFALLMAAFGGIAFAEAPKPATDRSGLTMESLAKDGFEIKALEQGRNNGSGYLVLMQRGGDIRSCILRIERRGANPRNAASAS